MAFGIGLFYPIYIEQFLDGKSFGDGWNSDPLASERNRSPEQLWILRMNIQEEELNTDEVSSSLNSKLN